jgi:Flp pilus assembly protein TadG
MVARKRPPSLIHEESGQSLVLVVIAMTLIILVAAFAVDASEWFAKHHQAQVSADASALAAANCLATQKCTSLATGGDAYNTATTYASNDGVPASSVKIGGGYVTVTTATPAPVTFAGTIGLHPTAGARAVASYDQQTVAADLYAQDCASPTLSQPITSPCLVNCNTPGITIKTSGNTTITGAIQTNGSLSITAHNNDTLGDMLYGDPAGTNCSAENSVSGGTTPYGPPQEETAFSYFPDTYTTAGATSNCTAPSVYYGTNASASSVTGANGNSTTYTGSSKISVQSTAGTPASTAAPVAIVNNVIQGTVTINGSWGMTSTPVTMCASAFDLPNNQNSAQLTSVTISAPTITLAANGFGITPNPNNTPDTGQTGPALAIYDSSTSASNPLDLSNSNNDNIVGTVYVPASGIVMGGNNSGLSLWEANTVTFDGNNAAGGPTETVPGLGSDALVQ